MIVTKDFLEIPKLVLIDSADIVWGRITGVLQNQEDIINYINEQLIFNIGQAVEIINTEIEVINNDISTINGEIIQINDLIL